MKTPTYPIRILRRVFPGLLIAFALLEQPMLANGSSKDAQSTPVSDSAVAIRRAERTIIFDGWGTSLCWFANAVGGWPEADRAAIADALFASSGLGLTVVRYNIGGGENPAHHHMLWFKQMEGFAPKQGIWNPDADAGQRWVLQAAIARGANRLEAFSNSPPYWMTQSGCASGGADPNHDNLALQYEGAFADYLADAVKLFHDRWKIDFDTLAPLNEPFTDYWKEGGKQEGCHFERSSQNRILQLSRHALDARGMHATGISASDETNYDRAIGTIEAYDDATMQCVAQLNAHAYSVDRREELRDVARRTGKPLVMSEVDGPGALGHDHGSMLPALDLAKRIMDDFNRLQPLRWVFWQAVEDETTQSDANKNWGLIHADLRGTTHAWKYTRKYYAMANFTRFIRPGAELLSSEDGLTIAVVDGHSKRLIVVSSNPSDSDRPATFDLSKVPISRRQQVRAFRTSSAEDCSEVAPVAVEGMRLKIVLPRQSISTYLVPLE